MLRDTRDRFRSGCFSDDAAKENAAPRTLPDGRWLVRCASLRRWPPFRAIGKTAGCRRGNSSHSQKRKGAYVNYLKVARNVAFVLMIAGWSMVGSTAPVSASTDLCVESGTCQYAVVHEFCNSTLLDLRWRGSRRGLRGTRCAGCTSGQMCEGNSGTRRPRSAAGPVNVRGRSTTVVRVSRGSWRHAMKNLTARLRPALDLTLTVGMLLVCVLVGREIVVRRQPAPRREPAPSLLPTAPVSLTGAQTRGSAQATVAIVVFRRL
jgi:hypothetical protein